jgi:hypothetical protein
VWPLAREHQTEKRMRHSCSVEAAREQSLLSAKGASLIEAAAIKHHREARRAATAKARLFAP